MTLIAVLLPFLSFLLRGKILKGLLCLLLQVTLIGWLPAALWAVASLNNDRSARRHDRLMKTLKSS